MMIKTILFDMGGVLLDLSFARCKASFQALGFDNVEELLDTSHHRGFFGMLEGGEIDEAEFYRLCKDRCSREVTDSQLEEALSSLLVRLPQEKVDYLLELRERYPLFVLSNNNPINVRKTYRIFADCGLTYDDVFKQSFYSHELKVQKPDPGIFRAAIGATGYAPSEILFIDDNPANAEGAAAMGLNALHYVPGTDLRSALEAKLDELNK